MRISGKALTEMPFSDLVQRLLGFPLQIEMGAHHGIQNNLVRNKALWSSNELAEFWASLSLPQTMNRRHAILLSK